jgi:hypothetical protein
LIELFSNIGNWIGQQFKWLFGIFLAIFYFFLRNFIWFAIFVGFGGIIGFASHNVNRLFYHSQMIVFSHTISNIEVIQSINNWNYNSIFTADELKAIKNIGATYLLDINKDGFWDIVEEMQNDIQKDTTILKQRTYGNFCIQIEVYDTTMISKIKTEVLNYLSNNQRVIERNKIRLKQMESLIPKLQNEIQDLDSLKKEEYFAKNKPTTAKLGEMLLIGEKETKLYHKDILDLIDKEQRLERDLFLNKDPFEIILDFSVPSTEENNLVFQIFNFMKAFFLLGLIVIFIFDQRKFIIAQIKKAKN